MSDRQAVRVWDRLRERGVIPAPRPLPSAKPLLDTKLPDWMAGLREDEIAAAWLASAASPVADPASWVAHGRSVARDDRAGRFNRAGRVIVVTRLSDGELHPVATYRQREVGVSPYAAADDTTVRDWLARDRDTQDEYAIALERIAILRAELGGKLADCIASGMTQREAAAVCDCSVATVERRLSVARRKVAYVS